MALTKLPKSGIADDAIDASKIEDGTIQNQEIQGSLTNEKFAGSIANDRLANSSITVAGTTISLGASTTIPTDTDWQALTVADGSTQVITEAGKGYFLDTNAGVIEVFLPSSPTRGDTVILADYAGTFGTNQIIINTGGEILIVPLVQNLKLQQIMLLLSVSMLTLLKVGLFISTRRPALHQVRFLEF